MSGCLIWFGDHRSYATVLCNHFYGRNGLSVSVVAQISIVFGTSPRCAYFKEDNHEDSMCRMFIRCFRRLYWIGVRAATRDSENGYNPPAWQAKVRDIRKIADSQEIST